MFGFAKRRELRTARILEVLEGRNLTAHEINLEIQERYGKREGIFPGALYPLLLSLEDSKKINSDWIPGPRPRKRIYSKAESD